MNKFYMNGKLIHKASDHNTKRCEVEKWVFLPHSDFERLKANPYQEHEAITAARDLMYEDKNAYHCIMLLDEYGDDGLLIEAEGFDYPRLSMFVPDAKSIFDRYQTSESELKLHDMIKDTVEKIAELAHTDKTDLTSADMIDMDDTNMGFAILERLCDNDTIAELNNLCAVICKCSDQDYIYQTIFNSDVRCINGIKKLLADRFMEFSDKLVLNVGTESYLQRGQDCGSYRSTRLQYA